jgi:beta-galactosidase
MLSFRKLIGLFSLWFCFLGLKAQVPPRQILDFNNHWEFVKDIDTLTRIKTLIQAKNSLVKWESVRLPHTPQLEPVQKIREQWQGISYYRKFFIFPVALKGKSVSVKFEGAMQWAKIYLNGKLIQEHIGGFLPFYVDISGNALPGQKNCLLIQLDNRDNPEIPPGKPLKDLDFNFYGGIYRDVSLIIKNRVHIAEPGIGEKNRPGGILVHSELPDSQRANIQVKVDLENSEEKDSKARLRFILRDPSGKSVYSNESPIQNLKGKSHSLLEKSISLSSPKIWSPETPFLYTLEVQLLGQNTLLDQESLRIGIKNPEFRSGKFFLNGKEYIIRGTNRHQEYPYLGYALSDNAQYRDAWKIKDAGFNFVRCSHYPPSPAFLDACDELGILVMDAIPGWQFFGNAVFQENSFQNIRDMVRRDRNHVSILLWEASLNETGMTRAFMDSAHALVHRELPFHDTYTTGWLPDAYDVFNPARQHTKAPDYWKKYDAPKPLLMAEYGDWEYYAGNAGFNQKDYSSLKSEERNSRQFRGDGEKRQLQQALNFQEAHNDNLYTHEFGDLNWVMFDYKRGYAPDIEASGIMDIFRLPKFSFYFYKSQKGPKPDNQGFGKPMIFIANDWNDPQDQEVKIYSNCEKVELFLNGRSQGIRNPDTDRNSKNLIHPPFTFPVNYKPGLLLAKGYIGGKTEAITEVKTPKKAYKLELKPDYSGKNLSRNNDVLFIHAYIEDRGGNILATDQSLIHFIPEKGICILGPKTIKAEAGIATILLKSTGKSGNFKIKAESPGLKKAEIGIPVF